MIHLKSYQPTHQQMARIEHAMVVNRRKYYALHEAGQLDRAEEVRLELDYLNLSYWKNHSHGQGQKNLDVFKVEGLDAFARHTTPSSVPETLENRA